MPLNESNILIETDNKVLDNNLVKILIKKFSSKLINRVLLIQPPDTDENLFSYELNQ